MLESIFIMLLILAIVLLILCVAWESLVISLIDAVIWFVLAIGVLKIEVPYQYTSGGSVYTATQEVTNLIPLSYLFMMFGVVVAVYWMTLVLDTLRSRKNMMRGI